MGKWALKDKNGKYRSRRSFKQDCRLDSEEPWEQERINKSSTKVMDSMNLFKKKKKSNNILDFGR